MQVIASAGEKDIVPFALACMGPDFLPTQAFNKALRLVVQEQEGHSSTYSPIFGLEELRRQIARRARDSGAFLTAEDVIVTAGAIEAISLSLRAVVKPGDVVAIESPSSFCFSQLIENLGMKAVEITTHPSRGLDLNAVEDTLQKSNVKVGLFMPNVQNPLGFIMSDQDKKLLVRLFSHRGIPIIEDDILGDLAFTCVRPKTLKAFDEEGLVLLCSSFSKTLSPGIRMGWVTPGKFRQEVLKLKASSTWASPSLSELALVHYLTNENHERHLRRLRRELAEHVRRATALVAAYFPNGTRITRPQGGFTLWVELPEYGDAQKLYFEALKHGIAIAPGNIFSASDSYRNCIRLSLGHRWTIRLEQALVQLGQLAHDLCPERNAINVFARAS